MRVRPSAGPVPFRFFAAGGVGARASLTCALTALLGSLAAPYAASAGGTLRIASDISYDTLLKRWGLEEGRFRSAHLNAGTKYER
jgi:hypothetical protein